MRTNGSKGVAAGLGRVSLGFAAWREGRGGRERIPDELWEEAVRAAREHGVNRVSKLLGLDYSHLKRRVGRSARARSGERMSAARFVELQAPGTAEAGLACLVELEKGNGARMRICVRDAAGVDWGKLKEAFLGA